MLYQVTQGAEITVQSPVFEIISFLGSDEEWVAGRPTLEDGQDLPFFLRQGDEPIRFGTGIDKRLLDNHCVGLVPVHPVTLSFESPGVNLTMLPGEERPLDKLLVRVRTHDDELDSVIAEELFGSLVVLGLGKINSAMAPSFSLGWIAGRGCPLKESVDLNLWIGEDEGEVEAFGREAVAHDAHLDWR
jgi:hypothetical protein